MNARAARMGSVSATAVASAALQSLWPDCCFLPAFPHGRGAATLRLSRSSSSRNRFTTARRRASHSKNRSCGPRSRQRPSTATIGQLKGDLSSTKAAVWRLKNSSTSMPRPCSDTTRKKRNRSLRPPAKPQADKNPLRPLSKLSRRNSAPSRRKSAGSKTRRANRTRRRPTLRRA